MYIKLLYFLEHVFSFMYVVCDFHTPTKGQALRYPAGASHPGIEQSEISPLTKIQ